MAVIPLNEGWVMETGMEEKRAARLTVRFEATFGLPPTVTVSPVWLGRTGVGHAETIVGINADEFTVASNNASGGDYLVSWIAVGRDIPT